MTHGSLRPDSCMDACICLAWRMHMCDGSCTCVIWLMLMCAATHALSFVKVPCIFSITHALRYAHRSLAMSLSMSHIHTHTPVPVPAGVLSDENRKQLETLLRVCLSVPAHCKHVCVCMRVCVYMSMQDRPL